MQILEANDAAFELFGCNVKDELVGTLLELPLCFKKKSYEQGKAGMVMLCLQE